MPKVNYVTHSGETYTIEVPVGWSVMEGAIQNDVPGIVAECGGGCACATCHVFVDPKWADKLAERSSMEMDMLECTAAPSSEQSRLSCQLKVSEECDGLIVHLPEAQT
ncbi:MAG: 2Fe-2S ferredoxin [Gammaproteobacteria bacterium]|jgi:2Fe-2S ferredoxin